MPIVKNKELKKRFQEFLKTQIKLNKSLKKLEIIQIGNNLASTKYIKIKQRIGQKVGLKVNHNHFLEENSEAKTQQEIEKIIKKVKDQESGLIFQLPVASQYEQPVKNTPFKSDVDLLGKNSYLLLEKGFLPPTIGAIDLVLKDILKDYNSVSNSFLNQLNLKNDVDFKNFIEFKLDFSGLNVAVIGQGTLVGKPAIKYFLDRQATVLALNKSTKNIKKITKQAEIVICGAGSKDLIDKTWLQKKSIVIDASTSESGGKLKGDVNQEAIEPETVLSPSPGGIGKLTVLYLFWNLLKLEKLN